MTTRLDEMREEEDAALVFENRARIEELEREMEEAVARLKLKTGDRQVGVYCVKVSSQSRQTVDAGAVKQILGDKTPLKLSVSVVLKVSLNRTALA